MKTKYANLILSLDSTCRNQLQQTLHVCRFWQVCVSSNLLSLGLIGFKYFYKKDLYREGLKNFLEAPEVSPRPHRHILS